jgi:hypothetical protein
LKTSFIKLYSKFGEPELPIFNFSLPTLLEQVRGDFPGMASKRVTVWLRIQPALATVRLDGDEVVINLHAVLNHAQTPEQVIGFILRHELLHMTIPKREVEGHVTSHPPEFWDVERKFPDRVPALDWVYVSFGSCLRRNKRLEGIFVTRKWKKCMDAKRLSLNQVMGIMNPAGLVRKFEHEPLF